MKSIRTLLTAALVIAASLAAPGRANAVEPAAGSTSPAAADPEPREIARRATRTGTPAAIRQTSTMTLVDKTGATKTRSMSISRTRLDGAAARWNTRIEIQSPKDVAGTVLLTLQNSAQETQHLYLPGLKRVRRVAGAQRTGNFLGSDFTYEDLADRDVEQVDFTRLPDEVVAGKDCWVLEGIPKKSVGSAYGKTLSYITKDDALTVRLRLFDAKGVEVKVLEIDPAKVQTKGAFRIPMHLEMRTLANGHRTVLDAETVEIDPRFEPSVFDPAALDRG